MVGAIAPKLEQAEIERAKRKPTESLDAYDYYLRGTASFHQSTREAIDKALPLFEKAIALDPDFASAYGTMAAWCIYWRKMNAWLIEPARDIAKGAELAARALELGRGRRGSPHASRARATPFRAATSTEALPMLTVLSCSIRTCRQAGI